MTKKQRHARRELPPLNGRERLRPAEVEAFLGVSRMTVQRHLRHLFHQPGGPNSKIWVFKDDLIRWVNAGRPKGAKPLKVRR